MVICNNLFGCLSLLPAVLLLRMVRLMLSKHRQELYAGNSTPNHAVWHHTSVLPSRHPSVMSPFICSTWQSCISWWGVSFSRHFSPPSPSLFNVCGVWSRKVETAPPGHAFCTRHYVHDIIHRVKRHLCRKSPTFPALCCAVMEIPAFCTAW